MQIASFPIVNFVCFPPVSFDLFHCFQVGLFRSTGTTRAPCSLMVLLVDGVARCAEKLPQFTV